MANDSTALAPRCARLCAPAEAERVRSLWALGPADARILGTGDFVAALLRAAPAPPAGAMPSRVPRETLAARLAASLGVAVPTLFGGTQTAAAVTARPLLAHVWVARLGQRASDLARAVGQTRGNVALAVRRGPRSPLARTDPRLVSLQRLDR